MDDENDIQDVGNGFAADLLDVLEEEANAGKFRNAFAIHHSIKIIISSLSLFLILIFYQHLWLKMLMPGFMS